MLNTTSPGDLLRRAQLLPLRGPWPSQKPGIYAIYYGRDHWQPVYVGQSGNLFKRLRGHWYWLRWRRGLAMDGLRCRALPLASREYARLVERELIDDWQPAWNAHFRGTDSNWFQTTYPKVAWSCTGAQKPLTRWREN
jgi:hypothetical protein